MQLELIPPVEEAPERQIIANRALCKQCNWVIQSKHSRDFVSCNCGAIFVDGGLSYLRRGGELVHFVDQSVFSDSPFHIIRDTFLRGTYGKDGKDPLTWVKLCDMDIGHLLNTIEYCKTNANNAEYGWVYNKELEWRQHNGIG